MSLFASIGFTAAAASIATTTLAIGSVALSAGFGAYSASQQASAQKQANDYQAAVARNNATIASQQRSDAIQRGEIDAQTAMRAQASVLGSQRASLAANGVDLGQGSALDQLASTKFLGAMDVNTIQSNAARTAWGYDVQNMNDNAGATLSKWQADSINPAGVGAMAGGQSILSSASSFAMAGGLKGSGAPKGGKA